MARETLSSDSLAEATRDRAKFSGHGKALGAAGVVTEGEAGTFLSHVGETTIVNPHEHGYEEIRIGIAWDNVKLKKSGFFGKLIKKAAKRGVDLDLGCLYELQDGGRGAVQAFGGQLGAFDEPPFIGLSGDERTGDRAGHDEYIRVNGAQWPAIKRILVYAYIYNGVPNWATVRPRVKVSVPGETPFTLTPAVHQSELAVCVIAGIENVRNGIKLTNHSEYFPGHAEMDRAFGFGLKWADGQKQAEDS